MCGRFAITLPPKAMRRLFGYGYQPNFPARYNIAPTQPIPIIHAALRDGRVARHFKLARWAFMPSFAKDPRTFPLIFNARAEGLGEKASFRNALRRRRCLVPADAFYEWHRTGSGKTARSQAYLCRRVDQATMALAGLWETWMGPDGEEVDTACIITSGANGTSAAIHPRLPAIIEPNDFARWLDPDETVIDMAVALLRPPENDTLTFVPIGDLVNKVANDSPEVQAPVGPPLGQGPRASREDRAPPDAQASLF